MSDLTPRENEVGVLFGDLFKAYDDESFRHSVDLFARRMTDGGMDTNWFAGKKCLDAGCGGGRYALALAGLGAREVTGVDISVEAIADARRRAEQLHITNVTFQEGSLTRLPFADGSFDCVISSGVLMHTIAPMQVLSELTRVLRPGGMLYALVYATEGLRWPLVQMLRPLAQDIGFDTLDAAVAVAGLPVNRRRIYLDDLFVPLIDFYTWHALDEALQSAGLSDINRWTGGRLDHEETIAAYAFDLRGFLDIFTGLRQILGSEADGRTPYVEQAVTMCQAAVDYADRLASDVQSGVLPESEAQRLAIGQGHHRFVAWKSASET